MSDSRESAPGTGVVVGPGGAPGGAAPRLEATESGLALSGALTLTTAPALFRDAAALIASGLESCSRRFDEARSASDDAPAAAQAARPGTAGRSLQIDLSALGAVDSAALAVLVEWRRAAKDANVRLAYVNAPAQLQALASACALSSIFGPQDHAPVVSE